jgi:hypothetical protein
VIQKQIVKALEDGQIEQQNKAKKIAVEEKAFNPCTKQYTMVK